MTGPLGKKDLGEAKAGLYDCRQLRPFIEKAQACGIDCNEQELRNEHLAALFQKLLDNYSPEAQPLT
jgi:hypothetical protein